MSDLLVLPVGPEAAAGDPDREIRLGTTIAVLFFVLFLIKETRGKELEQMV